MRRAPLVRVACPLSSSLGSGATLKASSAVRAVVIGTAAISPIEPTSVATTSFATTSRLSALPTPRSAALKSNRDRQRGAHVGEHERVHGRAPMVATHVQREPGEAPEREAGVRAAKRHHLSLSVVIPWATCDSTSPGHRTIRAITVAAAITAATSVERRITGYPTLGEMQPSRRQGASGATGGGAGPDAVCNAPSGGTMRPGGALGPRPGQAALPGLGLPGRARTGRRSPSRLRRASARLVLRSLPLVRHSTESREDEVAVTEPKKDREAAAEWPQSARQWRHLYLLQHDAAFAEQAPYAGLQVAVERVAAREAWLTWPERRG
jgi:hypothetical protein